MRFVYVTDVHGSRIALERAFQVATQNHVDALVVGGDLLPKRVAIAAISEADNRIIACPLDVLVPGEGSVGSYSKALDVASKANRAVGESFVDQIQAEGGILLNAEISYERLLAEQRILDALGNWVQSEDLALSEADSKLAQSILPPLFQALEVELGPHGLRNMETQCQMLLGALYARDGGIEAWKPSRRIAEAVRFAANFKTAMEELRELGAVRPRTSEIEATITRKMALLRYGTLLNLNWVSILVGRSRLGLLLKQATESATAWPGQKHFLVEYFLPRVKQWRQASGGTPVYAMLGNDDNKDLAVTLDDAEAEGILYHMDRKVHPFGEGNVIVGCSVVDNLPTSVSYADWLVDPEVLSGELQALNTSVAGRNAVWAIHQPPARILDMSEDNGPVGSEAVREFLLHIQPALALFGHIHEAPRLLGRFLDSLGSTICVNPGAEHRDHKDGAQLVLIDMNGTTHIRPV